MDDNWARCDAEAIVAALSVRYRFSRANAVHLLRDKGILRQRAEHDRRRRGAVRRRMKRMKRRMTRMKG